MRVLLALSLVACTSEGGKSVSRSEGAGDPNPSAPARPTCGGEPCLEVPTGIKGVSFGMSIDAAQKALKAVSWSELEPSSVRAIPPRWPLSTLDS